MSNQLTPELLDTIADIIGGLAGTAAHSLISAPAQSPQPASQPQQQPTPPPQQPQGQSQAQKPAPSPYQGWHKYLTKKQGRKPATFHPPTTPQGPTTPKVKPPKGPEVAPLSIAASSQHQRVSQPYAQPPQSVQAPQTQPPQDQHSILETVKREAQSYTQPNHGTNLAHWLRTHNINRSVISQFEAAGVESLDDLTQVLSNNQRPLNPVNLAEFHDDASPFAVISEPREDLETGGIPAVVVGPPYAGQVHQLEEAFPGVHFMAVEEAPKELEEAANILEKPLPRKSLVLPSPYAFTKAQEPSGSNATTNPSKPKEAPEAKQPKQPKQPKQQTPLAPIQEPLSDPNALTTSHPSQYIQNPSIPAQVRQDEPRNTLYDLENSDEPETAPPLEQGTADPDDLEEQYAQIELKRQEILGIEIDETEEGRKLQTARIVKRVRPPQEQRGKNGSWLLEYPDKSRAIFKPGREENQRIASTELPGGTFYLREWAAGQTAHLLGLDKMVPTTVLRSVKGWHGSVQQFAEGLVDASTYTFADVIGDEAFDGPEGLAWAAAFDYLTGNTDRHTGNWGLVNNQLTLVDHGATFPDGVFRLFHITGQSNGGLLLLGALKHNLKVPDLSSWANKWSGIESLLKRAKMAEGERGISDNAISLTKERLERLINYVGSPYSGLPSPDLNNTTLHKFFEKNRYYRRR